MVQAADEKVLWQRTELERGSEPGKKKKKKETFKTSFNDPKVNQRQFLKLQRGADLELLLGTRDAAVQGGFLQNAPSRSAMF